MTADTGTGRDIHSPANVNPGDYWRTRPSRSDVHI